MKKLILVLMLVLAFSFTAFAQEVEEKTNEFTGTIETGFEYTVFGELIDITEISVETEVNDTIAAEVILTVEELLSSSGLVLDVEGKLNFAVDTGETAYVSTKVDVLTGDVRLRGQYLGLSFADDFALDSYIEYKFALVGSDSYHAVSTLTYDFDEDLSVLAEGRIDSDGIDATVSAEIQATYAINEDIDVIAGYEMNDWDDGINDWDEYDIVSADDLVYAKVVIRF